jgi:hypothetical protein
MDEESPLLLPPAQESPEASTELAAAPESKLVEPAPEPIAEPLFVCECKEEWMRSACEGKPFYKEHEGKRYCVLHYPGKEKAADFDIAFRKKLEAKNFNFRGVWFPEAVNFNGFEFSGAANFFSVTFKDQVRFSGNHSFGDQSALDLQLARIEKPERLSFHTVTLRPYEEASTFRYWAMDLARHHKWAGLVFWKTDWLHVLYWTVSGYGERILRAFGCLLGVLIIFALLYTQVGFTQSANANAASTTSVDNVGHPLALSRAITYSLGVMRLQRPEPRPLTSWVHALVTLEMILGPVQAALLGLAIRRKFMR